MEKKKIPQKGPSLQFNVIEKRGCYFNNILKGCKFTSFCLKYMHQEKKDPSRTSSKSDIVGVIP